MGQLSTLDHNNGPTMEAGAGWRKNCWAKARRELLSTLPIEILRVRVARAKELGLDYTSYASIRAAGGHDVIAFLFSSNALRVFPKTPEMPADRLHKLAEITDCNRAVAVHRPLTPENLRPYQVLDHAFAAPRSTDTWIETRNQILTYLQTLTACRATATPRKSAHESLQAV